ncbi:hypothetical protein B0H19DRAFT_1164637 [Mycena capillaripes]|nr:hypothetical protein B0H19DRAFT_1164637 [Mycena capillaripes]
MPEWKPEVLDAFRILGIEIDVATQADAAKAYKTQAIRHHPDKNPGDPAATQRFQKLGAAWDVCQRHFEDPSRSYVTAFDDDEGIDPADLAAFFMFMFEEAILGNYAGRRDYRSRRHRQGPQAFFTPFGAFGFGAPPSPYYSGGYSGGYSSGGYSGNRQLKDDYSNERSQAEKKTAYEKRLREFEMEIAAEKREIQRQALEKSKDENKRAAAYQQAFQAARTGKASTVISLVEEYDLDVNSPEKMPKATSKKTDKPTNFQTLLHAACRACDEGLILFLLDKGALPDALNDAKLYPFHVAIACGNVAAVKFFLLRRVHGKQTPGCIPSKVAPDGRTPLQIAIAGGNAEMVALMTKEATVHDVERCWQQAEAAPFKNILLEKKGFIDPGTKESRRLEEERKLAEERAGEEQKVAEERARAAEKARLKEERQRRAAEQLALKQEQEAKEEQKRREEAELAKQKREAEERKAELEARQKAEEVRRRAELEAAEARRKAELEAAEKRRRAEQEAAEERRRAEQEVAEARRKAEQEARVKAEAEAVKQAAEARLKAEAHAEEQERARRQAKEKSRLEKAAKAEAKRIQREAETVAIRQAAEADTKQQAAVQAEALRIAAAENERLLQVAAQEAERNRRAASEQQKQEAKRAETLRRLQGQAEEHRRLAEARIQAAELERSKRQTEDVAPRPAEQAAAPRSTKSLVEDATLPPTEKRRKLAKKHLTKDLGQISPEELQKRAAQSARDKARIAEEKRLKMLVTGEHERPDTPESMQGSRRYGEDYVPPTPVSMPSPSQRRLSPPLVPHHTRPNVPARKMDSLGQIMLAPEDIQTAAIPDDLFAVERPAMVPVPAVMSIVAGRESGPPAFRGRGRGYRARGRGRGRGRGVFLAE